jgi:hypothetical protein
MQQGISGMCIIYYPPRWSFSNYPPTPPPFPRIPNLSYHRVGILPQVEGFLIMLYGVVLSRFILVYVTSQFPASGAPRNNDP